MTRVVLLHGAATTARIWDGVAALLAAYDPAYDVVAPDRPRTGDLDRELAWLAPQVTDSWVVGMSGGATLGLALAAAGAPIAGALLHEPAAGGLAPDLLTPAAAAFARGGTAEFGATLYGPSWRPAMAGGIDESVTARELAMFRSVEPGPALAPAGPVLVTYGAQSPMLRRAAAEALRDSHGYRIRELPGVAHFAAVDAPAILVAVVGELITTSDLRPAT
jgi:pimeloyl-ACP methyl ester carboxylesterase